MLQNMAAAARSPARGQNAAMSDAVVHQPGSPAPALPGGLTGRAMRSGLESLAGRRRGLRGFLPFAGPAIIASVAYMDPGNFATNIQAGSRYGYGLLWVVVLANLIAMLFQALSARIGIVSGKNLAELCRDQFPTTLVWTMWAV